MTENHIRENIKFLRAKLSMTQGEFGALFGVSRDNIDSYERGSEPKMDFISRIVNYFQISYDDFISIPLEGFPENPDVYLAPPKQTLASDLPPTYQVENHLPKEQKSGWQNIPVYELDSSKRLASLFEDPQSFQPIDYLAASGFPRCDGGVRVSGDGMAPLIKSGDVVFYKQIRDIRHAILWGEMYLLSFEIEGDEYTMVKYLHESQRPEYVRLISFNPSHAPKEIAFSQIRAIALVKGNMQFYL